MRLRDWWRTPRPPWVITNGRFVLAAFALGVVLAGLVGALYFVGSAQLDEQSRAIAHDRHQEIAQAVNERRLRRVEITVRGVRVAPALARCAAQPSCRRRLRAAGLVLHARPAARHQGGEARGGGGNPPNQGGPPGGPPSGGNGPPINMQTPPVPGTTVQACTPLVGVNCPPSP